MNVGATFEAEALQTLRDVPGVDVTVGSSVGDGLILRYGDTDVAVAVAVEVKRRANAATAWDLVHRVADADGLPVILIADDTTQEARRILTENHIGLIDGTGNAHIELPALLIHIEGRAQPRPVSGPPTRLKGKAGVAAQALLRDPERRWRVVDLGVEAGIAKGLAHRVLARLENEHVVVAEGHGPNRFRRVTNRTALLDLWAEEDMVRPSRTSAYILAQTPRQLVDTVSLDLQEAGIKHAVTGAAGASLVAPFASSVPVVDVWVTSAVTADELLSAGRAEAVPDGANVVFWQAKDDVPLTFRDRLDAVWVADRFRLYADLRRDPRRGREQADHLREQVIGF